MDFVGVAAASPGDGHVVRVRGALVHDSLGVAGHVLKRGDERPADAVR